MGQGIVERPHQEMQQILGTLATDVLRTYATEWTELLPIVEFLVYTTPGPHGYTPRDLDRNWSLGVPLQKDLEPFVDRDMIGVSDYAKGIFRSYREVRAKSQAGTRRRRRGERSWPTDRGETSNSTWGTE